MKKISDLGLTGRKLVGEGLILVIIGICFLIAGWQFPGLILRFIHAGLFFLALYELSMIFFRKKKSNESILALVGKAVLFGILEASFFDRWDLVVCLGHSFTFCIWHTIGCTDLGHWCLFDPLWYDQFAGWFIV